MAKRLQIRRDTDLNWSINNPILSLGEPGYVTDTKILKIGDGQTPWNLLNYFIPQDTDDIPEGTQNVYFTESRAISATEPVIQSASAHSLVLSNQYSDGLTTDDILEGNSLYFTENRALDAIKFELNSSSALAVSTANQYTDLEILSIIGSAPVALDTLNEIAEAINDDPNFYSTISEILGQKLNLSDASAIYLTQVDAETIYDTLGSADAAQSAATGYTDSAIAALTSDDIEEGSSNLYFTDLRALDAINPTIESASTSFIQYVNDITTTAVSEGTNLYFTNERSLDATFPLISSASSNIISEYTSYINEEVGEVVGYAPPDMDTLGKISSAINNDGLFYQTVNNLLNEKLNISSASNEYLTIQDAENLYLTINSASSLYVTQDQFESAVELAALSACPSYIDINSQSSSYMLSVEDFGRTIEIFSSASTNLVIPNDSSMPIGFYFNVTQTGDGIINIKGDPGVTIYSENNNMDLYSKYSSAYIYKTSASEWIIIKNNGRVTIKSEGGILYYITVDDDGSLTTSEV